MTLRKPLVICSGNQHKVVELADLLGIATEAIPAALELPPETGTTFEANALIKARGGASLLPGRWVLADDSGLEVDALDGAPGVYSARYAGADATDADNNAKLLGALSDVVPEARSARFRCVLALIAPDGREAVVDGAVEGSIVDAPRGSEGFGYDPLFVPNGHDATFAELGASIKSQLSHRARAARELAASALFLQLARG